MVQDAKDLNMPGVASLAMLLILGACQSVDQPSFLTESGRAAGSEPGGPAAGPERHAQQAGSQGAPRPTPAPLNGSSKQLGLGLADHPIVAPRLLNRIGLSFRGDSCKGAGSRVTCSFAQGTRLVRMVSTRYRSPLAATANCRTAPGEQREEILGHRYLGVTTDRATYFAVEETCTAVQVLDGGVLNAEASRRLAVSTAELAVRL